MTAPVDDLTSLHLDAASDDPSQARAELLAAITKLKEVLGFLTHRGALAYKSNTENQTLTSGVPAALSFVAEDYDASSIHDPATNNNRLTVPAGVSKVKVSFKVSLDAFASGQFSVFLRKNGSAAFAGGAGGYSPTATALGNHIEGKTPAINVTAGDYFDLSAYQNSGGSVDVLGAATGQATWFAMEIIE